MAYCLQLSENITGPLDGRERTFWFTASSLKEAPKGYRKTAIPCSIYSPSNHSHVNSITCQIDIFPTKKRAIRHKKILNRNLGA